MSVSAWTSAIWTLQYHCLFFQTYNIGPLSVAPKPLELLSHTVPNFEALVFSNYQQDAQGYGSIFSVSNTCLKIGVFAVFLEIQGLESCHFSWVIENSTCMGLKAFFVFPSLL